ncbi:polysaccharide deacetylase [Desertibacillus haloalkaliphilus]|uniref:polysaccharide deacetylase n=1 Tax=Desertibacillus haloalkaliphilus TaxID=1328930 RepID=UPI001C25E1EC|nr:polysaccharide deacetylase family protein [Desertibacillus haloalkaliphilus]MBU8905956.1 polysaccharide deacetylase family protein [Desertibacillus haloalkaliphilus]
MRRFYVSLFSVIALLFLAPAVNAAEGERDLIFVAVDDEIVTFDDVRPFVQDGTTYVPIRTFVNEMGVRLSVSDHKIYLEKEDRILTVDHTTNELTTDDGETLNQHIFITDGRTVAPYRAISEYFGYQVSYIPEGLIARVASPEAELSNEQLYIKYEEEIDTAKEAYQESLRPKKVAYLSFDDGPNRYTREILDLLEEYDVQATFFMMRNHIYNYTADVQKMAKDGHALACHGVTHNKSSFYRSAQSAADEMTSCQQAIKDVTGETSKLIRVPYGSVPHLTTAQYQAFENRDYKMWDWNVDSEDWKYSNPKALANDTIAKIKNLESSGQAPVVLFHDRKPTVAALDEVLNYLTTHGYELLPLTEEMRPFNFWDRYCIGCE